MLSMAAKKNDWIQKALGKAGMQKKGQLHEDLGVPKDQKIPEGTLRAAARRNDKVGQRARLAETLKGLRKPKKSS